MCTDVSLMWIADVALIWIADVALIRLADGAWCRIAWAPRGVLRTWSGALKRKLPITWSKSSHYHCLLLDVASRRVCIGGCPPSAPLSLPKVS